MRDGLGQRRGWLLSLSSKLNNRQERKRGKHHVDEVNIVLLWHKALAEAVRVGPEAAQEEGGVGLVAPAEGGDRPLGEVGVLGAASVVGVTCTKKWGSHNKRFSRNQICR
jgi:hypothetical protein